ncbi:hypothetical protein ACM39_03590 [Chryseobacterium sp. FH2]|uniref:hypothetical protein n=1 Tax=Chryseobacterium sp. FH2 TaxID=1674291 RepID=UPI00065B0A49|nr:hypothetical protein [Chryseobacterium sp. FH2]KMQ69198.1 hypothetical protein ACM39_03590 [Chryseobacterium sp. FH2]
MKILSIWLLLLFINCNSQQKIIDKKYMDMETTFQKYRDIKARYDSFVKKNKQSLIYENGAYLKKTLYEREKQEKNDKWIAPLQSESKFLLQEGDNWQWIVAQKNIKR